MDRLLPTLPLWITPRPGGSRAQGAGQGVRWEGFGASRGGVDGGARACSLSAALCGILRHAAQPPTTSYTQRDLAPAVAENLAQLVAFLSHSRLSRRKASTWVSEHGWVRVCECEWMAARVGVAG